MHIRFDVLEVPMVAFGLGNANSLETSVDVKMREADYHTHISN